VLMDEFRRSNTTEHARRVKALQAAQAERDKAEQRAQDEAQAKAQAQAQAQAPTLPPAAPGMGVRPTPTGLQPSAPGSPPR
jgi:FKBP-type peptidyl-prolyl cis-trans isomerase